MSGKHDRYPSLRITGFGNFAIEYLAAQATAADNEPQYNSVAEHLWRGRKQAQTVLKVLLCRPHRRAPREVLQEAIWPQGKGDSAETAFNAIISVLRHVLSLPVTQKPLLTISRVDEQTIYQLAPQAFIWIDADEAESLLTQAEQARRDDEDSLPLLEQAYHFFCKGPFLAEDDGAWVQQRKWHMDEAAHRCTHWLIDLYEERGLLRQATTVLSTIFESDPTDEDILSRLMCLLVRQERRQEALRCYQHAERALHEEDLEPTPAIKKLAERIRNDAIEIKGNERFVANQHIPLQTTPLSITQGIIGTVQESESLDMDKLRRRILQQTPTFVGTALLVPHVLLDSSLLERLSYALAKPASIDNVTLCYLEQRTNGYWQDRHSAALASYNLLGYVLEHLQRLTVLLESSLSPTVRMRLCSIVCGIAQLTGTLYFDIRDYARARAFHITSIKAAQEANNQELEAVAWGRMSFAWSYDDNPQEALLCINEALHLAERSANTTVRSWLAATAAEIQAILGEQTDCFKSLKMAESIEGRYNSEEDNYWLHFDRSRLLGYQGACFRRLYHPENTRTKFFLSEAQISLKEALLSLSMAQIQRQPTLSIDMANTFLQQGEYEEASRLAIQAAIVTAQTKSQMVTKRLITLRNALDTWKNTSSVKSLDEHMSPILTPLKYRGNL